MGCAEMIRSGTTCFNDMYYYPVETANLVSKIGMRAVIGLMARDGTGNQNAVAFPSYPDSLESGHPL